jgi:hypothetical protein
MKTIKILFFLALLCLTLQRTEKKGKTNSLLKTSNKGVGSNYAITIGRDNQNSSNKIAQCNFRTDKINSSDPEGHMGLPFDNCKDMDGNKFTNVFYKTGNYYLLEYKKCSDSVSATNPSGDPMFFYFNVNVNGSTFTYYFVFEYNTWSSVIDFDNDLNNSLRNQIINAIRAQKLVVNNKKTQIRTEAVNYNTNKPLYDSETAGSLNFATQITAQKTAVTTKTTERTTLQTKATATQSSINTKTSEIATLKSQRSVKQSSSGQNANSITTSKADVAALTDQKTKGTADTTGFQAAVDQAKPVVIGQFALFEADTDFDQAQVKAAKDAILTKISLADFQTAFAKILPNIS